MGHCLEHGLMMTLCIGAALVMLMILLSLVWNIRKVDDAQWAAFVDAADYDPGYQPPRKR